MFTVMGSIFQACFMYVQIDFNAVLASANFGIELFFWFVNFVIFILAVFNVFLIANVFLFLLLTVMCSYMV